MAEIKNAILLADKNYVNAGILRYTLSSRGFKFEHVCSIEEFISSCLSNKKCLMIIDKRYYRFSNMLKETLERIDVFKNNIAIFINSPKISKKNLENNDNIFVCDESEIIFFVKNIVEIYNNKKSENVSYKNIDKKLMQFLIDLEISPKYAGFNYLLHCLIVGIKSGYNLSNLQRNIYSIVADEFNATNYNIERNVRSLLTSGLKLNRIKKLAKLYLNYEAKRITTKSFLILLLMLFKYKEENSLDLKIV